MQSQGEQDSRSPLAIGYTWSIIVSSIAFEMVLPILLGFWIDQKLGTLVLFTLLGAVLGMTIALLQLIQLGKPKTNVKPKNEKHET
ncbi:MAG: AtpZ/AtpI family protein [Thermoguttaceae bacterium]